MITGIFAIHGIILGLIILLNGLGNRNANRVLASLLLIFSIILLEESLEMLGYQQNIERITGFGFLLELFLAPLTLIYAKIVTGDKVPRRVIIKNLAAPILINALYMPYHLVIPWDLHFINNANLESYFISLIVVKISYQLIYQLLAIFILNRFISNAKHTAILTAQLNVAKWLRNVLVTVITLIPIVILLDVIVSQDYLDPDHITSLIMTISIYSIGYASLRNPLVYPRPYDNQGNHKNGKQLPEKYSSSPLQSAKKKEYVRQLSEYMEKERPYQNQNLSLDDVARGLKCSKHHLSQVLNEEIKQNFYDYVNSFRVKSMIRKMSMPEYAQKSVLVMGMESGFNSKATLNRAFKKETGQSPKDFIKKIKLMDQESQ